MTRASGRRVPSTVAGRKVTVRDDASGRLGAFTLRGTLR